jgi:ATP-dependent Clp protease adaptor protein ClpS
MATDRHPPPDGQVITKSRSDTKIEQPKLYKVILHNDHYTTQEFVVQILMDLFGKAETEAHTLMLAVHHEGSCVGGVYTHEIAETKVAQVTAAAESQQFPFLCTMELE